MMAALMCLSVAAVIVAGCRTPWMAPESSGEQAPADPPAALAPRPAAVAPTAQTASDSQGAAPVPVVPLREQPTIITHVTFDVLRARVPRGLFSESGKIWNHLDEDVIPADTVATLNRNGFRVARGRLDAWPPIKTLLETQTNVKTSRNSLTMSNGAPLLLELDQRPRDQLVFMYRPDGTLAGAPWPASTNLLRIEYGIAPTDGDALLVEVMPQLRQDGIAVERSMPGPPEPPSLVLRQLAFRMQIDKDQFLVVGPSAATGELPYIIGSLLLCEEGTDGRSESMYFITPRVSRSGEGGSGGTR